MKTKCPCVFLYSSFNRMIVAESITWCVNVSVNRLPPHDAASVGNPQRGRGRCLVHWGYRQISHTRRTTQEASHLQSERSSLVFAEAAQEFKLQSRSPADGEAQMVYDADRSTCAYLYWQELIYYLAGFLKLYFYLWFFFFRFERFSFFQIITLSCFKWKVS